LYTWFGGGPGEKDNLEGLGADGRIILRWIIRKWFGGMDWIYLS